MAYFSGFDKFTHVNIGGKSVKIQNEADQKLEELEKEFKEGKIDEETFEKVQQIAKQKKTEYHERLGKFAHLEHT